MEAHEGLLLWAKQNDVKLYGIAPRRMPGRGIGVVATRALKKDQLLLEVPSSLLRTLGSVPRSISRKLPREMTVHGLLAADIVLDDSDKYSKWNAVMPTKEDLMTSVPLAWDPDLHEFLPKPAKDLLRKQQAKLKLDWDTVHAAFPSISEDDYLYAWLLVNTRSFYHTIPKTEKLPRADHMVLQPVADLLNHSSDGCAVAFTSRSFTICSDRAYAPGEEVCICYGRHGNDLLLAEYGFTFAGNRWDEACIDDAIVPRLSARQRELLEECGFLGGYMLDAETACHRTQVALRILCAPMREWRAFVDGLDDGEARQDEVDRLLVSILQKYRKDIQETMTEIEKVKAGQEIQRRMLKDRWAQIDELVAATILRLEE